MIYFIFVFKYPYRRRQLMRNGLTGMFPVYTLFSSCWLRLNFCPVVALDPSMLPTSLDHCLDTLSNYSSGREPCTDKVFSPRLGVLSGFVFQRRSPGDTTLSEPGDSYWVCGFFKVGIVSLQIGLQIGVGNRQGPHGGPLLKETE